MSVAAATDAVATAAEVAAASALGLAAVAAGGGAAAAGAEATGAGVTTVGTGAVGSSERKKLRFGNFSTALVGVAIHVSDSLLIGIYDLEACFYRFNGPWWGKAPQ